MRQLATDKKQYKTNKANRKAPFLSFPCQSKEKEKWLIPRETPFIARCLDDDADFPLP